MLHFLDLYKNVRITPDYSVVQDHDPDTWKQVLDGYEENGVVHAPCGEKVWSGQVNYYRLADVIRIEGNFDDLRTVTYGCLTHIGEGEHRSIQRPLFFWVNRVRLIRQATQIEGEGVDAVYKDTVEMEVSEDVWSNNMGSFELFDSYVVRRHMDRWKDESGTLKPIYYPNASQGVEGAYVSEAIEDLTTPVTLPGYSGTFNPLFIIMTVLDNNGKTKICIGVDMYHSGAEGIQPVHIDNTIGSRTIFDVKDILNNGDALYTAFGITANNVQSITVTPFLPRLANVMHLGMSGGVFFIYLDAQDVVFRDLYSIVNGSDNTHAYITLNYNHPEMESLMRKGFFNPTVIAPSYTGGNDEYADTNEPMMYLSPARIRKITSGFGGEVFTVPDIAAFRTTFGIQNMVDFNGTVTYVFTGNTIEEGNVIGSTGLLEAATLPIFNSAWKSYEAINKVGDEIAYNAKQMQTIGNGIAGTAVSGIGGFVQGGPLGAILGVAAGATGTVLGAYGNEEELRAKQTTVKNSPCTVKSGGSGLGAFLSDQIDFHYVTLKLDDVTFEKIRQMYYWFGYIVERTFKGTIALKSRRFFDFIKTERAKIRGDVNAEIAQQIASIFDAGVTIYHDVSDSNWNKIGDGTLWNNDEVGL